MKLKQNQTEYYILCFLVPQLASMLHRCAAVVTCNTSVFNYHSKARYLMKLCTAFRATIKMICVTFNFQICRCHTIATLRAVYVQPSDCTSSHCLCFSLKLILCMACRSCRSVNWHAHCS